MLDALYDATLLAFESNAVIASRMMKLATGGPTAWAESELMVREKLDAAIESAVMIGSGASLPDIISRYREHVAANASRLSNPERPR
jgi:hypothetical protein